MFYCIIYNDNVDPLLLIYLSMLDTIYYIYVSFGYLDILISLDPDPITSQIKYAPNLDLDLANPYYQSGLNKSRPAVPLNLAPQMPAWYLISTMEKDTDSSQIPLHTVSWLENLLFSPVGTSTHCHCGANPHRTRTLCQDNWALSYGWSFPFWTLCSSFLTITNAIWKMFSYRAP